MRIAFALLSATTGGDGDTDTVSDYLDEHVPEGSEQTLESLEADGLTLKLLDVSTGADGAGATEIAAAITADPGTPYVATYSDVTPGTRLMQWVDTDDPTNKSPILGIIVDAEAPPLTEPVDSTSPVGTVITMTVVGTADGFDDNTTRVEFWTVPTGEDIDDGNGVLRGVVDSPTAGEWSADWDTTGEDAASWQFIARRYWVGLAGETGFEDSTEDPIVALSAGYDAATAKLVIDSFAADGTWSRPTLDAFWGTTGNDNKSKIELWAAGGGGVTATGAGGGGAYACGNDVDVSGSSTYAIGGLTAGKAGSSAADATFGSTLVVAAGGKSGSTSKGGLVANCTGDVKHAGGDGGSGGGTTTGGAGGGASGDASGATPGEPGGGHPASGTAGFAPGAGGGSAAGSQQAGARGHASVIYQITATSGYARLRDFAKWRATANATSHSPTMPGSIVAGEKLVAICNANNTSTLTASGWTKLGQQDNVAVFYKTAAGSDTITVAQGTSGRVQTIIMRWAGAGTPEWTATAQASASNGDPPSHTSSGGSVKGTWIAIYGSTARPTITDWPSGYGNRLWVPPISSSGTLAIGMKEVEASSENPGAFTINSAAMVVATLLIPPP